MPKNIKQVVIALSVVSLAGCGSQGSPDPESFVEQSSYAIGVDLGSTLRRGEAEINMASFSKGFSDGYTDEEIALTDQEIQQVLREFSMQMQQKDAERRTAMLETNQREGEAYLDENGGREGVTTTATGLQYEVIEQGAGPKPSSADRVSVNYSGSLVDGTEFDSSNEPVTFAVGGVIPGWTEALQLMNVGSKFRVVVPSALGYGERGNPPRIGPNATLIFEIELVEIAQ